MHTYVYVYVLVDVVVDAEIVVVLVISVPDKQDWFYNHHVARDYWLLMTIQIFFVEWRYFCGCWWW